jgi:hypothetical protein
MSNVLKVEYTAQTIISGFGCPAVLDSYTFDASLTITSISSFVSLVFLMLLFRCLLLKIV